jgi:hypothetical protein
MQPIENLRIFVMFPTLTAQKKCDSGKKLSIPSHQEKYREQQLGHDELLNLSAEGDMRSRKRLLAMLVSAAALWLLIYAMARLLFH